VRYFTLDREFPVANLEDTTLAKVQQLEETLREETGEEIVLIAYKNEKNSRK